MKTLACILMLSSSALGADKREFHTYDGPFDLRITQVRSIAPEKRLGPFTKSLPLFAVEAQSVRMSYVLYCVNLAPQSGVSYKSKEAFVSEDFSFLRLWPTQREDLPPGVADAKGVKTLYRVVEMDNVSVGKHPDLSCDIHTETPIKQ